MADDFGFNLRAEISARSRARVRRMLQGVTFGISNVFDKREIEQAILKNIKSRFDLAGRFAQKSPEGQAWAPLARSTARRRKQNTANVRQALVDTGSLRDDIIVTRANMIQALTRGVGFSRIGPAGNPLGSDPRITTKDAARVHQFGQSGRFAHATLAGRPSKNFDRAVPARPFLGVGRKEGREIGEIFAVSIRRALRGFGRP